MQTTEVTLEIDQDKVKEILARFALPDEIERVETTFKEDHTGDPSVYLTFHVREGAKIGREDITRLSKFLSTIASAMLNEGIGGFPYTRLE
ncbi:MAG TPA: hypothetical protein VFC39_14385 [Acidobacteriaceae bacterium]|nr:hypothetical protein [Acidobacteriaceae bacterium]